MLKILFMGTPEFSCPILEALNKEYEIVGVVTQPDKEQGRHREIVYSPVKQKALELGLKIFQPIVLKDAYDELLSMDIDLIVTAAYGQFVGTKLLNKPTYGAINCHGSLLPKYRGGAPIQEAIKQGEKETGITIMRMVKQMDAGNILAVQAIPILDSDTGGSIFEKLSLVATSLVLEVIPKIVDGIIVEIPQDETKATFAYNITKEDQILDPHKDARSLFNHVRAYFPHPLTYLLVKGVMLKIIEAAPSEKVHNMEEGSLFKDGKSLYLACGENTSLEIKVLQEPGKNKISGTDFVNGSLKKYL